MYTVCKTLEISAAHHLALHYPSKCAGLHGHNWIVKVWCAAKKLNEDGMVVDFAHIKEQIHGRLDHANLNEVLGFNPTAENIAKWIVDIVPHCFKAEVQESAGNLAIYEL